MDGRKRTRRCIVILLGAIVVATACDVYISDKPITVEMIDGYIKLSNQSDIEMTNRIHITQYQNDVFIKTLVMTKDMFNKIGIIVNDDSLLLPVDLVDSYGVKMVLESGFIYYFSILAGPGTILGAFSINNGQLTVLKHSSGLIQSRMYRTP